MRGILVKFVPVFGRINRTFHSVEQGNLVVFLQFFNCKTDRRLNQMKSITCFGET